MAKLTPSGKKRYSVTLTPERVERFQALAARLKLPPNAMSCAIDDLLHDMCEQVFEPAIKQGTFGLDDIFRIMGENVKQLMEEETKREEKEEKCPDCGRPMHRFHHCELNPVANPEPKRYPDPE